MNEKAQQLVETYAALCARRGSSPATFLEQALDALSVRYLPHEALQKLEALDQAECVLRAVPHSAAWPPLRDCDFAAARRRLREYARPLRERLAEAEVEYANLPEVCAPGRAFFAWLRVDALRGAIARAEQVSC